MVEVPNAALKEKVAIEVRNLRKIFVQGWGKFQRGVVAVKNLDLDIYEGQITALLGHNGARKTTTISILTGLFAPTKGKCFIYGKNLRTELKYIRKFLGVCPQHNVLFDNLTVKEHLELYGQIKGVEVNSLDAEVKSKLIEVGLQKKRDSFSKDLSGGMKRKLSVAISLIDDSKVIFLDEPTSGMDPYSRRATWDLLRSYKKDRVIVLTTHFMDEADMLGDQIAIMSDGKLKCAGSSLFLKSRFGVGYNLTLAKETSDCDSEAVENLITKIVPEAKVLSEAAGEVSYQLPFSSKSNFPFLFESIETSHSELGIGGYGVSMTTLEEVFLKVGQYSVTSEDVEIKGGNDEKKELNEIESTLGRLSEEETKHLHDTLNFTSKNPGFFGQFGQLYYKRFICARRDLNGRFFELMLPVLMVVLTLSILKINFFSTGPSLNLNEIMFRKATTSKSSLLDVYIPFGNDSVNVDFISSIESTPGLHIESRPEYNSTALSVYLLESLSQHRGARYTGYIFNDSIDFTTVNHSISLAYAFLQAGYDLGRLGIFNGTLNLTLDNSTNEQVIKFLSEIVGTQNLSTSWIPSYSYLPANVSNPTIEPEVLEALLQQVSQLIESNVTDSTNVTIFYSKPVKVLLVLDQMKFFDFLLNRTHPQNLTSLSDPNAMVQNISLIYPVTKEDLQSSNVSQLLKILIQERYASIPLYLLNQELEKAAQNVSYVYVIGNDSFSTANIQYVLQNIEFIPSVTVLYTIPSRNFVNASIEDMLKYGNITRSFPLGKMYGSIMIKNGTISYRPHVSILHNMTSYHSIPAGAASLSESVFRKLLGNSSASFSISSYPLPLTPRQSSTLNVVLAVLAALFVLIPFCYLPASFSIFIVKERAVKATHIQLVSGASINAYWLATYMWDITNYFIIAVCVQIVFLSFQNSAFVGTANKGWALFLLFIFFGTSIIPLSYIYSLFFVNHSNAQVAISAIHFATGFVLTISSYMMDRFVSTARFNK